MTWSVLDVEDEVTLGVMVCINCHDVAVDLLDGPDGEAHRWNVSRVWGDGWSLELPDYRNETREPSFSWSSCEGCNSPLGGERYPAYMTWVLSARRAARQAG